LACAPAPNGILDDEGRLFPHVAAARRRGIIFDFGNGVADHFNWSVVERATKRGFWPDTFSTDWNVMSRNTGVVDFQNIMSKFIMFGMPGAPADVAIMELREGTFDFLDNYKSTRTGPQRLFPIATVLAGKQTPARAWTPSIGSSGNPTASAARRASSARAIHQIRAGN
jgi:dihydroorotase